MEPKPPHVQDNSVVERRLRPIYEWLDSGNNKKALQECDKVLKKTSNLSCAKALKAVALLRSGRENECNAILDALALEKPTDGPTLQAMTICYRELDELEKIHPLYEAAIKLNPSNEELHTHLFMSYVRISDFKAQQQAAMTLYKLKPRVPYYCWAIMSIILQATRGPDADNPVKRNVLISLAERMITKVQIDAEQEIQLYIMILQLQEKHEQILKILEGQLDEKLVHINNLSNKLPHLKKLNRWEEINVLCKKLLVENPDKWDVWKEYIASVFQLHSQDNLKIGNAEKNNKEKGDDEINHIENHDGDDLDSADNNPEKAHEFVCRIVENGASNEFQLRGPYLARFELLCKLSDSKLDFKEFLGEPIDLFVEYFHKFGHKPCCVSDLRIYLGLLDEEKRLELAARLMQDVGISATSVPQSSQQMQRHICAIQLARLCGSHRSLSEDHLKALVTALSLHYQHGYQTYGRNLLPTDQGPSDPYIIIGVHILYDIAQMSKSSEPLVLALVLLDNLLKNSPSNFHAKLLAVKLYHTLGAPVGAQGVYDNLEIKHLQLDSLGFIHCGVLPRTGFNYLAFGQYENTFKFFSTNYKDSSDHLTFSYKYGSFLKLEEFMDFRDRLNNSYHYALVSIEKVLLIVVSSHSLDVISNTELFLKEVNWDKMRYNQDFKVFQSWYPEMVCSPDARESDMNRLFEQDKLNLRLRSNILHALDITIRISQSLEERQELVNNLAQQLDEWETLYSNISSELLTPISETQVTYPFPSRLHISLELKTNQIIRSCFQLIKPVLEEEENLSANLFKSIESSLVNIIKEFEDLKTAQESPEADQLFNRRSTVEKVVNICEVLCISTLVYSLCLQITKPSQGKKGKKRQENRVRESLQSSAKNLKGMLKQFDKLLEQFKPVNSYDLTERLAAINLSSDCQTSVLSKLSNSHVLVVKELQEAIKDKSKMLDQVLA